MQCSRENDPTGSMTCNVPMTERSNDRTCDLALFLPVSDIFIGFFMFSRGSVAQQWGPESTLTRHTATYEICNFDSFGLVSGPGGV